MPRPARSGAWIDRARKAAADAGVAANTSFEVAQAKTYPGSYDFVAFAPRAAPDRRRF